MTKTRLVLLAVFASAAVVFYAMDIRGVPLVTLSPGRTLCHLLAVAFMVLAIYEAFVIAFSALVQRRKGSPTEVIMLGGLARVAVAVVILLELLYHFNRLSGSWAALAAFGGMLMGWSLQAPVSGVAAWVMVNIKRPFRIGDRVQLPTFNLIGDVRQVGMMYTVLNQVGGTVGSEEAAGRNILIPNAMLFGNIVINYTPEHTAAFMLDEVVVRITYDSDWVLAEHILLTAANEVIGDIIQETGQQPYIRSDLYDYGVYMRLRFMTVATDRPRIVHEITKRVFREFQATKRVDFAIPYIYSYRAGVQAGVKRALDGPSASPAAIEVHVNDVDIDAPAPDVPPDPVRVSEMATKIASIGLLQPIVVERKSNGRYSVIAGHLRLAACRQLGWTTIPATVRESSAVKPAPAPSH